MKTTVEQTIKMLKIQSLSLEEDSMTLQDWMNKVRINLQDLSEVLGVSRSFIYLLMDGDRNPSKETMNKLSDISMGRVRNARDLRKN